MKLRSVLISTAVLFGALVCGSLPAVQAAAQGQGTAQDNTKVNKGRQGSSPTADQGKNNKSDLDTQKKIRKAVVDDKSLSSYGHNVKIISQNGRVTLKGPVRSEDEKKSIEQKATDIAGAGNVTNEITIQPAKKAK